MADTRKRPLPDVRLLLGRCAGLCAFCRKFCEEGRAAPGDPRKYGKIAHIYAHGDLGPRSSPDLTAKQRDCYENWIWVCSDHHDEIDDPDLLQEFPAELLLEKKRQIEAFVRETLKWHLRDIGFPELEAVCAVLALTREVADDSGFELLEVDEKIRKNDLGPETRDQITWGLGKAQEVGAILEFMDRKRSGVAQQIAARFKAEYHGLWSGGLKNNQLFDAMRGFANGVHPDPAQRAAGLAVLVYLFERCEVFEK